MEENLLSEIEKRSGVSRERLLELVREKLEEFSGLISEEGAIYLVARDLGIELLEQIRRKLEIKNVVPGMRKVNLLGRVFKISPIVEFERRGAKGRVTNVFIGDATGYVRLPLWNDQAEPVEEGLIRVGDAVQVTNAFARENIFGEVEICLGKYGSIREVEGVELPHADELTKRFLEAKPERKRIEYLKPGKAEILATIVQIFRSSFLFEVCPLCNAATTDSVCEEHGQVEPEAALVISTIVDDGSSSLRAVFFRELAERLVGLRADEIKALSEEERYERIKERLLGRELVLLGNLRRNRVFGIDELLVNEFKDLNILEESKELVERLKLEVGLHGKD